jgi:hypothetical protein
VKTHKLTGECWTIGSYLRSAAKKFEELAADCRKPDASPSYAGLASTFDQQKEDATKFAQLFEQADSVTIHSEEA